MISKCLFVVSNSPKKTNLKIFALAYWGRIFFCSIFWRIEKKSPFKINWLLVKSPYSYQISKMIDEMVWVLTFLEENNCYSRSIKWTAILFSGGQVKGQIISKGLFDFPNCSKKQTKNFDLSTVIPPGNPGRLVFIRFLEELKK